MGDPGGRDTAKPGPVIIGFAAGAEGRFRPLDANVWFVANSRTPQIVVRSVDKLSVRPGANPGTSLRSAWHYARGSHSAFHGKYRKYAV